MKCRTQTLSSQVSMFSFNQNFKAALGVGRNITLNIDSLSLTCWKVFQQVPVQHNALQPPFTILEGKCTAHPPSHICHPEVLQAKVDHHSCSLGLPWAAQDLLATHCRPHAFTSTPNRVSHKSFCLSQLPLFILSLILTTRR